MRVHTPQPNKGWRPEGTATWQRAENARQSLLAYMRIRERRQQCAHCGGQGAILASTPQSAHLADGTPLRRWSLPVVCPHCRPEDFTR